MEGSSDSEPKTRSWEKRACCKCQRVFGGTGPNLSAPLAVISVPRGVVWGSLVLFLKIQISPENFPGSPLRQGFSVVQGC